MPNTCSKYVLLKGGGVFSPGWVIYKTHENSKLLSLASNKFNDKDEAQLELVRLNSLI